MKVQNDSTDKTCTHDDSIKMQDLEFSFPQPDLEVADRAMHIQACTSAIFADQKKIDFAKNGAFFFTGAMFGSLGSSLANEIARKATTEILFPVPLAFGLISFGIAISFAYYGVGTKFGFCKSQEG